MSAQDADDDPVGAVVGRVIASAGIEGRFAAPICDGQRLLEPRDEALYTYALTRQSRAADRPLVLDSGGLLTPNGVMRFAAENDPDAVAELVATLGYRALAFGERDLAAPRASLVDVLHGLRARRIPTIASNLRCGWQARALCEVLVDGSDGIATFDVGRRRAAVLSFLEPEALGRIAPELAEGVSIAPIAEAMPELVRRARARADMVIAVVQGSPDDALNLAATLPDGARPDLFVLGDVGTRLLSARPHSLRPVVVAAPPGDAVEVVLREDSMLRRDVFGTLVQPLAQQGISVGEPVRAFLERIGPDYCDVWGRSLAGGHLDRPMDAAAISALLAELMRERVDADVAIFNRPAIDSTFRPARADALTESDVNVALEYDDPILVAEVPREWLTEVANRRTAQRLETPGLTGNGGDLRVRGRTLTSRATYRVATVRFLALGGAGALPALPPGSHWTPIPAPMTDDGDITSEHTVTLREAAIAALSQRDHRDPRDARRAADSTPEWLLQATVDGTFSGSSVSNPASYDASLLNRSSTVTLGAEVNLRADATAADWTWENSGVLRYRTQWTASSSTRQFTEAVDQIQLRSSASYRGLRATNHDPWIPDPYVEVFIESELTIPSTRAWQWFLTRPTVGARFPLTADLELKVQTGLQTQPFDPAGEVEPGLGAVLTLRSWDLLRDGERRVQLAGLLDYFLVDVFDTNRWQLRGSFDGSIDLAGPLALTLGLRLYAQQDRGQDVGLAVDATAGFRIGALSRLTGP